MRMGGKRFVLVLSVLFVLVCGSAVAGGGFGEDVALEELGAPTGIKVEVVYKDTHEPVVGAVVTLTDADSRYEGGWVQQDGTVSFGVSPADEPYRIEVSSPSPGERCASSLFLCRASDAERDVTVSAPGSLVHVLFELERGWEVSGTVRRQDGSPLAAGLVVIEQGESSDEWAYATTNEDGTFRMLGVAPATQARLKVYSSIWLGSDHAGFALLSEQDAALDAQGTAVDLQVATASLRIVLDIEQGVGRYVLPEMGSAVVGIWLHGPDAALREYPDVLLDYGLVMPTSSVHRALMLRALRYSYPLKDLPAGENITLAVGTWESDSGYTFHSHEVVTVDTPPPVVRFRIYGRGARRSRTIASGIAVLVVLAVCVPILVRQMRKRRGAAEQGE